MRKTTKTSSARLDWGQMKLLDVDLELCNEGAGWLARVKTLIRETENRAQKINRQRKACDGILAVQGAQHQAKLFWKEQGKTEGVATAAGIRR